MWDPGLWEMFRLSTRIWLPQALSEPDQVILTHELSEKLFGGHTSNRSRNNLLVTNGKRDPIQKIRRGARKAEMEWKCSILISLVKF